MKRMLAVLTLLLAAQVAAAHDDAWILQTGMTSSALAASGAALTDADSISWPDGRSAHMTYWLGTGDVLYRCAELRGSESVSESCWRQEIVAATASGPTPVRTISTRRRAPVIVYGNPYGFNPRVWVGVSGVR